MKHSGEARGPDLVTGVSACTAIVAVDSTYVVEVADFIQLLKRQEAEEQ